MGIERRDVVVLGGGPAGSTFAAILKKYEPNLSVTVLEKARFPRYHIGESLIPALNPVLRDLGIYDDLGRAGFIRKMGITFVWGRDRTPWDADYLKLGDVRVHEGAEVLNVLGQDFSKLLRRPEERDETFNAFNVRRAEFDHMIMNRARDFGADVREGTRGKTIHKDEHGRVTGVDWEDDQGREGTIETSFILDASGQGTRFTPGGRVFDPHMNNYAVYGYWSGAEWKILYRGTRDRTNVFICSVDKGWIWYIPVAQDLISVGVVTNTAHFKDALQSQDPESFYHETIQGCPEVRGLLSRATNRDDFIGGGKRISVTRDWSSWAKSPTGPGWATAGDAAIFVDPILSSGVTLAMQSGHRAAYTYRTARARRDLPEDALWRAYADYIRGEAGSFLRLARYFYGNNRAAPSWWWEAQTLVNASGKLAVDDRQAFTMASAGFFPTLRAVTDDTVIPLVAGITGLQGDVYNVFYEDGLPPPEALPKQAIEHLARFRLALRTEPMATEGKPTGQLDVFYDLVSDDADFTHRTHAAPSKIAPALGPVVEAMGRHHDVASLLAEAPRLLPAGYASPEAIRAATLSVVRAAAKKGFVKLAPGATA
ncbi:NAD(P)/FAD-dependent oxidoreductase [Polyangium mundeleinium]|uniref:NAD(P)/FAD-dependent oxidoreductase n=1 Tax=Polyangium mundeleinium TaxID=2995306 RepID=A0ABT5EQ35_9BACT|nr:NAD(P)/FAD-dependent oxidoreductase [Polyangium mundeleinium]MDC0743938.1 NAD(P)/FAD-dependent oxidoreductase [Polyangium mundeleinium]